MALLWCALVTSLGATMTAVAGLAIHAGYHDSHVGITKRVVRFIRSRWKGEARGDAEHHHDQQRKTTTPSPHPPPSMLSAITDGHKEIHAFASFRAAVVSARVSFLVAWFLIADLPSQLLGTSVALLAMAMAVYLFIIYPLSVAITTTVVGLMTVATTALPMLPIVTMKSRV